MNSEFVKRPRLLLPFLCMFPVPLRLQPTGRDIYSLTEASVKGFKKLCISEQKRNLPCGFKKNAIYLKFVLENTAHSMYDAYVVKKTAAMSA